MIKDSGTRRGFSTGSVRDCADGKGRCDLLPLTIIGVHMDDQTLIDIGTYIYNGDTGLLWDAIMRGAEVKLTFSLMWPSTTRGAQKSMTSATGNSDNVHVYIDSRSRHYLKVLRGDTDENHQPGVCMEYVRRNMDAQAQAGVNRFTVCGKKGKMKMKRSRILKNATKIYPMRL